MKVLVACESSGTVRDAFIKAGYDAMSCDLLDTQTPGPHYTGNVLDVLHDGWDLLIGHPPCTYLSVSGMHWTTRGLRDPQLTENALEFAQTLFDAPIPMICIENPVSIISSRIRKPDQIIQPYEYGHDASKKTCLWLKSLQPLTPTQYVEPRLVCCGKTIPEAIGRYGCPNCNGGKKPSQRWANQTDSGQNALPPSKDRWRLRSKTYQGIADAMASQWTHKHSPAQSGLF